MKSKSDSFANILKKKPFMRQKYFDTNQFMKAKCSFLISKVLWATKNQYLRTKENICYLKTTLHLKINASSVPYCEQLAPDESDYNKGIITNTEETF